MVYAWPGAIKYDGMVSLTPDTNRPIIGIGFMSDQGFQCQFWRSLTSYLAISWSFSWALIWLSGLMRDKLKTEYEIILITGNIYDYHEA